MAFGSAVVTSPAASKTSWATCSPVARSSSFPVARSSSVRRNSAARNVGTAVVASFQQKPCLLAASCLGIRERSKVSAFDKRMMLDASTAMNDEDASSTHCATSLSSNTFLFCSQHVNEAGIQATPSNEDACSTRCSTTSSCNSPLLGLRHENQEIPVETSNDFDFLTEGNVRSADHFSRIAFELGKKACFKTLPIAKAFEGADQDHDGMLTEADMKDVFWFFSLSASDGTMFFKLMDKDGRGRICWRETIAVLALSFRCHRNSSL